MTELDLVQRCEERLVNVWPAVHTLVMGDWVLRFANGYAGRTNSASAVRAGADLGDADLAHIIALYRGYGLDPAIRVTPLCREDLGAQLMAAGWAPVVTSIGMVAPARPVAPDAAIRITPTPGEDWINGVTDWQDTPSKRNPAHLKAIVGNLLLPAAFATVHDGQAVAGYGMSALDRGMAEVGSILLGVHARGRGLGRRLVAALMGWAHGAGAEQIFLQVEHSNAVAIGLYRSLGFEEKYRYTEYRLKML